MKRFLAGDFVRRECEVRHLFLGNNSFFRRGYLGKQLPQLPHAKKGIISEKLVAKNETASDAFLNLIKSTVFGRFETTTRLHYAPRKLHSRVALLEKVH